MTNPETSFTDTRTLAKLMEESDPSKSLKGLLVGFDFEHALDPELLRSLGMEIEEPEVIDTGLLEEP